MTLRQRLCQWLALRAFTTDPARYGATEHAPPVTDRRPGYRTGGPTGIRAVDRTPPPHHPAQQHTERLLVVDTGPPHLDSDRRVDEPWGDGG